MTKYRIGLFRSYWMRVLRQAASEASRRWWVAFGSALILVLVSIVVVHGALNQLVVFAVLLLGALLWFVLVIPSRIESEMQRKEEALRVAGQRQNIGTEIRNLMVSSRTTALRAREKMVEGETSQIPVEPGVLDQEALRIALAAQERLEWLTKQTGQLPFDGQIREIQGAVSSEPSVDANEAIRQLERLAEVFERQLVGPDYR